MEHSVNSGAVRIARPDEVRTRIGVSRAKFWDMVSKGQFPKPFTIIPGGRAVGWLGEDVDTWIMQRAKGDEAR